jgi:hypothetical protein
MTDQENRYCIDCHDRLTYFEGKDIYYCWNCHERFDKKATFDIGDLEAIMQSLEKAKKEGGENVPRST